MGRWIAALICLALGALFIYLAVRGLRRAWPWLAARRFTATVRSLRFDLAPENVKGRFVAAKSGVLATLEYLEGGRAQTAAYRYAAALAGPSTPGQRVRIAVRADGKVKPAQELRPWWLLQAFLGAAFAAVGLVLLVNGREFLAQLSEHTVDAPTPAGSFVMAVGGAVSLALFAALLVCVMPIALRQYLWPLAWLALYALGMLEAVDAEYLGVLTEYTDDSTTLYPLFALRGETGTETFRAGASYRIKARPGEPYTVYRSRRSGRCCLAPQLLDYIFILVGLIPLWLLWILTSSLGLFGLGALLAAFGLA